MSESGFPERKEGDRSETFSAARQSRPEEYDPSEVSSHHAGDRFSDPAAGSEPGGEPPFDPAVSEEPVPVVPLDVERMAPRLDLGGEPASRIDPFTL